MASPEGDEWANEMNVEFDFMKKTDLLSDPVQILVNGIVIGTKWVYKRKRNPDGAVERLRALLLVYGSRKSLDYTIFKTYAQVARLSNLRMVCTMAVLLCLSLASLDLEAAFIKALLYEELYIRAPPGTE